ncbi:MAG: hypothetical protein GW795_09140 [Cyanobacteria bacterium]|nr:hypothetical protein [Cyanobacteria bacterium CG_2015-16_32_12]NCO78410.1 hypothetical protein [Cyanobacteria bacterium CG_2015-22_32_23]NCQ03551.1 hypothetical protein [Cyanobacteria bacterium CG_2015-09_32_10]NCQ42035.1 hypothetical protein [Cyanobacteria bacterium CG_2015-04_32_10]NCS84412.1 hypothetical protein [Cyanobacteria bacterium CG_2015-02_32_10]
MNINLKNGTQTKTTKKVQDLVDPNILKSAKEIYSTYCHFHVKLAKPPIGVAIDKKTHRGQLLFTQRPILLPWENFIPMNKIES